MDPLTIGLLLVTFAKSFAEQAGSRAADLMCDQFGNSAAEVNSQTVANRLNEDPGLADEAADAINHEILTYPVQAESILNGQPGLLQPFLGKVSPIFCHARRRVAALRGDNQRHYATIC